VGRDRSWTVVLIGSLASVHTYSAEALPFGRELAAAEEEAKKNRKNVGHPRRSYSWA
jgi:hypothetical protein